MKVNSCITSDNLFSKLAIVRKHFRFGMLSTNGLPVGGELKLQESGIAITISTVGLMIFTKFLTPFFGVFFLAGCALLGVSAISTFREVKVIPSQDDINAYLCNIR